MSVRVPVNASTQADWFCVRVKMSIRMEACKQFRYLFEWCHQNASQNWSVCQQSLNSIYFDFRFESENDAVLFKLLVA
jgi:hypothetical protein